MLTSLGFRVPVECYLFAKEGLTPVRLPDVGEPITVARPRRNFTGFLPSTNFDRNVWASQNPVKVKLFCRGGTEDVIGGDVVVGHDFLVGAVDLSGIEHDFLYDAARGKLEDIEAVDR